KAAVLPVREVMTPTLTLLPEPSSLRSLRSVPLLHPVSAKAQPSTATADAQTLRTANLLPVMRRIIVTGNSEDNVARDRTTILRAGGHADGPGGSRSWQAIPPNKYSLTWHFTLH